jgi:hypothetical protein
MGDARLRNGNAEAPSVRYINGADKRKEDFIMLQLLMRMFGSRNLAGRWVFIYQPCAPFLS